MRSARLIVTVILVAITAVPLHAAPPGPFTPQPKTLTTPRFVPGGRSTTLQPPSRFVPPRTVGGGRPALPPGGFKPPVTTFKPPVTTFKPPVTTFKPPVTTLKPPVTTLKPPVTTLKPPVTPLRPLGIVPRDVPAGDRLPIAGRTEDPLRDRIPGLRDDVARIDPFELRDRDGDGIPDIRDRDHMPPGPIDLGGAGGEEAGPDAAPPVDPVPPVADAGPTAWDWVAIGLAAAAFADGLADRHGGCFTGNGIVIERPLPQAVPADPLIVHHEQVVAAQPIVGEQSIAVAEPDAAATATVAAATATATEPTPEPLPQLRAGEAFELPAQGLGATPGRVAVSVGAVILECPVTAWTAAGLQATVPTATLAAATRADLIVALADGPVAAVVPVELLPARQPAGGVGK